MVMLVFFGDGLNLFFVIVMVKLLLMLFFNGEIDDIVGLFVIIFDIFLLNWVFFFFDIWIIILWFLMVIFLILYVSIEDVMDVML